MFQQMRFRRKHRHLNESMAIGAMLFLVCSFSSLRLRGCSFRSLFKGEINMKKQATHLLALVTAFAVSVTAAACKSNTAASLAATSAQPSTATSKIADSASTGFPFTLVTQDNETVTFDHVPQRVLSTNPNTGEELMALGLGDKIIVTCYNTEHVADQWRKEYESKPVIAEKYPSLETVLNLNPDFIYGRSSAFGNRDSSIATHKKLQENGIMSLASIEGYKTGCDVEDVYQDFYNLGRIFQVEDKANQIVEDMKRKIAAVEEKVNGAPAVKVFDFDSEQDGGAYTPGNNFTSKLIRHAGGVNIFENLEKTWNTVSWEAVVEANPDIIVINDYGDTTAEQKKAFLKSNQALANVNAIKNDRFLVITLPEVFASARVPETIEKFARAFHPDAFAQ